VDLIKKIQQLKEERNAVIIAHNYQNPEVQDLADFTGDSLELARKATQIDARVIVFCGVHFMAETAAILNPDKTVLLPDEHAGCPMADMITGAQLRAFKKEHPGAAVVCYVNSSAEVKAESDACCTSSNAIGVVDSFPNNQPIIFVPDRHLGSYVAEQLERELILWQGYCPTHVRIDTSDIERMRKAHPDAVILTHPECPKAVRDLSDEILSTGQMCAYARGSTAGEFVIVTELGINHRLEKEKPDKPFYAFSERAICPNMKKITKNRSWNPLATCTLKHWLPARFR